MKGVAVMMLLLSVSDVEGLQSKAEGTGGAQEELCVEWNWQKWWYLQLRTFQVRLWSC